MVSSKCATVPGVWSLKVELKLMPLGVLTGPGCAWPLERSLLKVRLCLFFLIEMFLLLSVEIVTVTVSPTWF